MRTFWVGENSRNCHKIKHVSPPHNVFKTKCAKYVFMRSIHGNKGILNHISKRNMTFTAASSLISFGNKLPTKSSDKLGPVLLEKQMP